MNVPFYQKRFGIYTAKKAGDTLYYPLQAGDAFAVEDANKPYYVVKMWALEQTYYLARNRDDNRYTLFARNVGDELSPNFQKPIGFGVLTPELKTHLEIQFTFPRQRVFMSLFPSAEAEASSNDAESEFEEDVA